MSVLYVDSSGVLSWLFDQAHAGEVRSAIEAATHVVTSDLTIAETERAFVRAEKEGKIRSGDAQRLRGMLQREQATWMRMAVTGDVLSRAAMPFPVEPVKTLDAIHLATALAFTKGLPDLRVLSLDRRIQQNAEAMGIV